MKKHSHLHFCTIFKQVAAKHILVLWECYVKTKYSLSQELGNLHIRYVAIIVFKTDKQTEMARSTLLENLPSACFILFMEYRIPLTLRIQKIHIFLLCGYTASAAPSNTFSRRWWAWREEPRCRRECAWTINRIFTCHGNGWKTPGSKSAANR